MRVTDGGYAGDQYSHEKLRARVADLRIAIPYYMQEAKADGIVVTGKSGLSLAFACLAHFDFPLVVCRKDGETSHGSKIEGAEGIEYKRLLVLDDFVSSGATIHAIQRTLDDRCREVAVVGVIEWKTDLLEGVGEFSYDTGRYERYVQRTDGLKAVRTRNGGADDLRVYRFPTNGLADEPVALALWIEPVEVACIS